MADWYVSSAAWTAISQFAASHAYSIGDIVRPLTAPAITAQYAFRCTTAGTSSTEPTWLVSNNSTITTGGATFTNVGGQSTYGWSAAVGSLQSINFNTGPRVSVGDRMFVSSDHSESVAGGTLAFGSITGFGFGLVLLISVNRGGSVPPVQGDVLAGATITITASTTFDPYSPTMYYGFAFVVAGGATQTNLIFCSSGQKPMMVKNSTITFTNTNSGSRIGNTSVSKLRLDNVPVTFANAGQGFGNINAQMFDFTWINTPNAISGTTPTGLFSAAALNSSASQTIVCRGVDLSAITGTLFVPSTSQGPISSLLFDSCRIASGVARYGTPNASGNLDEIELVNCYDGSNFLAERHTTAGDLTTEFTITLSGGAVDNVGAFSHKMVSSSRSDKSVMPLEGFWMDVNNSTIGGARTATVEIISSASLNNDDITLLLEYEGIAGSSLASFVTSFPNPLATPAAIATSTATWNSSPATPVKQKLQVTFTPQTVGRVRGQVRLGKPSTTVYVNPQLVIT